jgi:non-heme chloroperoxidase
MKVEVKGINLFYEAYGSGIPIIFLHGYPLNHTIWNHRVAPPAL